MSAAESEGMAKHAPGWAIELIGQKIDLDDCREQLPSGFDPWVEDYESSDSRVLILRSLAWAKFTEAVDMFRDAERLLTWHHGIASLLNTDARPLRLGATMRFDATGKREPIIFASVGHFTMKGGRWRGRSAVIGGPPKRAQESTAQRWLKAADSDETRAELLAHISRADNWFDLYKSMELTQRLAGDEPALKIQIGSGWSEWERIRRTANCYRHAPNPQKYPLPKHPAELNASRIFILSAIAKIL